MQSHLRLLCLDRAPVLCGSLTCVVHTMIHIWISVMFSHRISTPVNTMRMQRSFAKVSYYYPYQMLMPTTYLSIYGFTFLQYIVPHSLVTTLQSLSLGSRPPQHARAQIENDVKAEGWPGLGAETSRAIGTGRRT